MSHDPGHKLPRCPESASYAAKISGPAAAFAPARLARIFASAGLVALVLALAPFEARSDAQFEKIGYYNQVKRSTAPAGQPAQAPPILGGGQVQTWGGQELKKDDTITLDNLGTNAVGDDIVRKYDHAVPRIKFGGSGPGLPIGPTGANVITGWNPETIKITDIHKNPNTADVAIKVDPLAAGPLTLKVLDQSVPFNPDNPRLKNQVFTDYVKVHLKGTAEAGVPKDKDLYHSADSFAAVRINGAKGVFAGGNPAQPFAPPLQLMTQSTLALGPMAWTVNGNAAGVKTTARAGGFHDPFYIAVFDVTAPTDPLLVAAREVFAFDVLATNGLAMFDATSIRLVIDPDDPTSKVEFVVDMDDEWVRDPYTYGATLSASGLTAFGNTTPFAGWQMIVTDDYIEARFDFGPEGRPFDFVEVQLPDDLFTPGRLYSYDAAGGGGAFEVQVPEPATCAVFAAGLLGLSWARRRPASKRVLVNADQLAEGAANSALT
jgi:hypothetical protein